MTRMKLDERCEDASAPTARSQFAGIELLQYLGFTPSTCLHDHSEGCRESSAISARRYLCSANFSSSNSSSIYSQDDSDEGEDLEYASAGRQQRNPIELAHTERFLAADLLRRVRASQDNTPPLTAEEATTIPRWLSWGRGTRCPSQEIKLSLHSAPSSGSGLSTDQQHSSKTTRSYAAKLARKMRKRFSGLSFTPPMSLPFTSSASPWTRHAPGAESCGLKAVNGDHNPTIPSPTLDRGDTYANLLVGHGDEAYANILQGGQEDGTETNVFRHHLRLWAWVQQRQGSCFGMDLFTHHGAFIYSHTLPLRLLKLSSMANETTSHQKTEIAGQALFLM